MITDDTELITNDAKREIGIIYYIAQILQCDMTVLNSISDMAPADVDVPDGITLVTEHRDMHVVVHVLSGNTEYGYVLMDYRKRPQMYWYSTVESTTFGMHEVITPDVKMQAETLVHNATITILAYNFRKLMEGSENFSERNFEYFLKFLWEKIVSSAPINYAKRWEVQPIKAA